MQLVFILKKRKKVEEEDEAERITSGWTNRSVSVQTFEGGQDTGRLSRYTLDECVCRLRNGVLLAWQGLCTNQRVCVELAVVTCVFRKEK